MANRKWIREDEDFLREKYHILTDKEISIELNRTETSIKSKASKMKLIKNKNSREGFRVCKKCKRELKRDENHFDIDKACKDELRNICRECSKAGKFRDRDYRIRNKMTDESTELFIKRYPHYTNLELIELFYSDMIEKDLWDRAYRISRASNVNLKKKEHVEMRAKESMSIKLSEKLKGRVFTLKHRENISISKQRYFKDNDSNWKGRVITTEERQKMSDRQKGKMGWSKESKTY